MFLFYFFLLVWLVQQSAVKYITWPARTVNPLTLQNNSENGILLLLFSFLKVLKCCTYIKKKNIFSTISTMTHKFTWKWGRWSVLTETDRNQSKQSNFELSKVQFHWIAKYLCKIEIVENSIFVFQVLPPQDSKLLG